MPEVVEVRFKGNRKEYFSCDDGSAFRAGSPVVVQLDRGRDLGYVSAVGEAAARKCGVGCEGCAMAEPPATKGKVLRSASPEDAHLHDELRKAEADIRRKVMERVRSHSLSMKVSDAEWQWDRKKLTIYFTADKRVDFRALVRDLAGLFRTRIELRQIGARDEAKRLDGVGRCGRQFCCSSWLPELKPVSLSLAKDQRLSLNPVQISGGCGRLLCCLRYEHDFYVASRRRFPKEGRTIHTRQGAETVVAVDIFRELVLLRDAEGSSRTLALPELKDEVAGGEQVERPAEPRPPSTLITFDESAADVVAEAAAQAPRKRRRRRGRRRGRGPKDRNKGPSGPPESGTGDPA